MSNTSPTALLLNLGHALDHLFLLIFATAVAAIAADWGMAWQDLMPYTTGAFVMFGLGSLPSGRLGDLWGRRAMMVVFFAGMGVSGLLIAMTSGVWQLAVALTLMGAFASRDAGRTSPHCSNAASRPPEGEARTASSGSLGAML